MSNPKFFLTVFKTLFLVLGLGFLAGGGYFTYRNYLVMTTYSQTKGTVIKSLGGETTRSVVEYQASGKTYTITSSVGSNPPAHQVGDQVSVFYPATSPDQGQFNTFLELWFGPLMFGGMGAIFAAIGGGMFVHDLYRQRVVARLRETGTKLETDFMRVQHNTSLEVNGAHPFQVVSQYEEKASNKVYTFTSEDLWFDPTQYVKDKSISVLVNPQNYRQYYMDLSFLPQQG